MTIRRLLTLEMNKIISITPVSNGAEYIVKTTLGSYTVTSSDLNKLCVTEGEETDEELEERLEKCALKLKCIKKAFDYLSYGDMSEKKLYTKLTKHFDKKLSAYVASLMVQRGYINENERALYIAKELYFRSRYGVVRIKARLYQQMFGREAIEYAANNLGADDETDRENIGALIAAKYGEKELDRDEKQKAVAYLVRMGYTYDSINGFFRRF